MAAAVSKLMRNQDLIQVAKKCAVTTRFRNTIGLRGRMCVRLQPNHPFDDTKGITASILDGLLIWIGRRGDRHQSGQRRSRRRSAHCCSCSTMCIARFGFRPRPVCSTHVTTTLGLIEQGAPVDLVFQSIAGTEAANRSFGIDLALLTEGPSRPGWRCSAAPSATM